MQPGNARLPVGDFMFLNEPNVGWLLILSKSLLFLQDNLQIYINNLTIINTAILPDSSQCCGLTQEPVQSFQTHWLFSKLHCVLEMSDSLKTLSVKNNLSVRDKTRVLHCWTYIKCVPLNCPPFWPTTVNNQCSDAEALDAPQESVLVEMLWFRSCFRWLQG